MSLHRLFLLLSCALLALSGCVPAVTSPSAWDLVLAAPAGAPADAAQSAADAYAHATGLRVGVKTFPVDAYGDRVSAVLLAGTGEFDLVYLSAESLPKWVDYHTLEPLTLPEDENSAPWLPLITMEGEVYGVPVEPDVDVLWYRTDVFEAVGVEVPYDLDAFFAVVKELAQIRIPEPLAVSAGELDAGGDVAALLGKEFLLKQTGTGWQVNREALNRTLFVYHGVRDWELVAPNAANWSRADVQRSLQGNQAVMGILPLSAAGTLQNCDQSDQVCEDGRPLLAFVPLPEMENSLGVARVNAWAVPLKAPHPDAAQDFAAWLAAEEGARAWANGGGLPAHRGVLTEIDSPAAKALADVEQFRPAFPPVIPAADIWQALHTAGHEGPWRGGPWFSVDKAAQSIETALRQSGYTVIEE